MLEKEMASIARFIIESAGNPKPYFNEIMKDFVVPSIYFPPAEVRSSVFSLDSYEVGYSWFIKFFAQDKIGAYEKARVVMEQILKRRQNIPLYDIEGNVTGEKLRVKNPKIKALEDAAYQLMIEWDVVRGYEAEIIPKMKQFKVAGIEQDETGFLEPENPDYIANGGNE